MIWSVDFDDESGGGIGLEEPNHYKSPESATIIPMLHTTISRGQTFTVNPVASTDVVKLPNKRNQNTPQGPGATSCQQCSFFRLLTSTCCGSDGSVGCHDSAKSSYANRYAPLPAGYTPNQSFRDSNSNTIPACQPLLRGTIVPRGITFTQPFTIPAGMPLREGKGQEPSARFFPQLQQDLEEAAAAVDAHGRCAHQVLLPYSFPVSASASGCPNPLPCHALIPPPHAHPAPGMVELWSSSC
ncbi:hypothetical protein BU25DRAFT_444940 [Macroventuria anomochaeta]|uniref:Uncharacterized protein n=1 Tax=Macroventuria anomochaeta TaxID=301207 RepID=A0ACB6SFE8_9PLEO|nr:uncharacterized protein BU25DRAFT_444940 [Macroventuria anomochaeta]KAF2632956.1 hypothetical protein BU25DRAFT_444940 [Macroventuria anomochaeta]